MPTNEISGNLVVLQVKLPGGAASTWRTLVCNTTLNAVISSTVNTVETKCGLVKSMSPVGATFNASGVVNTSPSSSQLSAAAVADYANNQTLLEARVINLLDTTQTPSIAAGAAVLVRGSGRFTSITFTGDTSNPATFDTVFEVTGTVDTTEADES